MFPVRASLTFSSQLWLDVHFFQGQREELIISNFRVSISFVCYGIQGCDHFDRLDTFQEVSLEPFQEPVLLGQLIRGSVVVVL